MKIDKYAAIYFSLAVLPLIVALAVYGLIPEAVTIVMGVSFSTGKERIFILPVMNLIFGGLIYYLFGKMDKALRSRVSDDIVPPDTYDFFGYFRIYIISFFDMLCLCSIYGFYALDWGGTATAELMCRGASIMLGIGGLLVARQLPSCNKRSILSLRWSYTEKSENVWYLTHKLGGLLFCFAGVFSIICALLIGSAHSIFISALAYGLILFFLYQYSKKIYFDEFK